MSRDGASRPDTAGPVAVGPRAHEAAAWTDAGPPPAACIGLVTRTLAFAVDALVINVVAIGTAVVVGLALTIVTVPDGLRPVAIALAGAAYAAWVAGYFSVFWSLNGETPGCRVLRIAVRDRHGQVIGLGRALLRFAALLLAAVPLGAGLLPILFDERRRGLQDLIARTVVVEAPDQPFGSR